MNDVIMPAESPPNRPLKGFDCAYAGVISIIPPKGAQQGAKGAAGRRAARDKGRFCAQNRADYNGRWPNCNVAAL
ncbi:MAG TPA: hypothetical protein VGH13_14985, partial [Xanthobacteraceae bacterium]